MARQSSAAQRRALEILLIEDDPIDAAWLRELIVAKVPASQVVQAASLQDALPILGAVGDRPVVAPVNAGDMAYAADVRAARVKCIYCKHRIWRIAHIRKQRLRDKWNALLTDRERAHDARLYGAWPCE